MNLADRFAAKSHAPDLAFVYKRLNRLDALLVTAVVIPRVANEMAPLSWRAFLDEITHGARVLLREPALRQALALSLAEATAGAAAIVVTVAYVRGVLGHGETAFAIVMAELGLGSTLASILLGRATGRYERPRAALAAFPLLAPQKRINEPRTRNF